MVPGFWSSEVPEFRSSGVPGSEVPGSEVPGSEVPGSGVPKFQIPGSVFRVPKFRVRSLNSWPPAPGTQHLAPSTEH